MSTGKKIEVEGEVEVEVAPGRVFAPFSVEQVESLLNYQSCDYFHPFTCKYHDDGKHFDDAVLWPTVRGWICPCCDFTQNWAHTGMADFSWEPIAIRMHLMSQGFVFESEIEMHVAIAKDPTLTVDFSKGVRGKYAGGVKPQLKLKK